MLTSVYYNYQDSHSQVLFLIQILVVRSQFLSLCKTNKLPCEQRLLFVCLFVPSKHWFLSCMVFSVYDVVRVAFPSRSYKTN